MQEITVPLNLVQNARVAKRHPLSFGQLKAETWSSAQKAKIGVKIGVSLVNISHIAVEGLEIEGGTHGVYYQSTREAGQALTDIRISGCTVHGVRGTHGICVYARNDLAPVQNLTIEDCEVYDCDCGDSESMVLNGNVDGFVIKNNVIQDNNNRRYNQ